MKAELLRVKNEGIWLQLMPETHNEHTLTQMLVENGEAKEASKIPHPFSPSPDSICLFVSLPGARR